MQKILHFHLPKTGGSAIRHHLIEQMGVSRVSPSIVGVRLKDALLQWSQHDAISGHFFLHQADKLPADRRAITVLRNPIDRFLSDYFFGKNDNAGRLLDARRHALDLDAYLESLSPQEQDGFSLQMEMLYPLGTQSQARLSADERLAAAISALDAFRLVGVQDELEDFASMLDTYFSWTPTPLALENVTSRRIHADSLRPHQLRSLHMLLEREFELYSQAKYRFKRDRRSFIARPSGPVDGAPVNVRKTDIQSVDAFAIKVPATFGDKRCTVKEVFVSGEISGRGCVAVGEQMIISIKILANEAIDELNIGIAIKDERGLLIFGTNSMLLGDIYSLEPGEYTAQFRMLNRAGQGHYGVDIALIRTLSHYDGCYHWLEEATFFDVQEAAVTHFDGRLLMDANIELIAVSQEASWSHVHHAHSIHQIRSLGRINKPLDRFVSKITPMCDPKELEGGADVLLPIRVENFGDEIWPAFGQQPVVLSYRWLAANGAIIVADGLRTRLPSDVPPGGTALLPLMVRVPYEKGSLQLLISLVQEGVAWFVEHEPYTAHTFQATIF
jgi:Sulfotransferase family.